MDKHQFTNLHIPHDDSLGANNSGVPEEVQGQVFCGYYRRKQDGSLDLSRRV